MLPKSEQETDARPVERQPRRVRLPGFLIDEEIGLGEAIKRVTYGMGIKPCEGCEKRASALDRLMHFSP